MSKHDAFSEVAAIMGNTMFIDNENIFVTYRDEIHKINKITKKETKIIDKVLQTSNIAYDGEKIYYLNKRLQLISYDLKTGEDYIYSNIRTDYFRLVEGKIVFSNLNDTNKVGIINLLTLQITDISLDGNMNFFCDNNYLYFIRGEEQKLYRQNLETFIIEEVSSTSANNGFALPDCEYLFLSTWNPEKGIYDLSTILK